MRLFGGLLVVVGLAASACGDSGSAGCIEIREPLDPASIQHVLDPAAVTYQTDPPTSGPHLSGPAASGLLDSAIIPAAQVRVLEAGGVVVQYRDPIEVADVRSLLDATEVSIVIAPAETLPAPVVATAWTWKLTCETVDLDRIQEFAVARSAEAPGSD